MGKQYKTLEFKDSSFGRAMMERALNKYSQQGWSICDTNSKAGRRSLTRTVGLGLIFLPLALVGVKKGKTQIILEREV
ncbi:MAG: hypothetical protein WCI79_02575 [Candidatus Saccharibacteria bacterium]